MKYKVTRKDIISGDRIRIGDCTTFNDAVALVKEFFEYDWTYLFEINGHCYGWSDLF